MATPVVTVASGGLPVIDVTATFPKLGLPVTEALAGKGIAVTKVTNGGLPVTFSTVADYPPATFTPAALTGLIGWWNMKVPGSITISTTKVVRLNDQSGAGNHIGDGIDNVFKPVYSATGLNGSPALSFLNAGELDKSGFQMGTGNTLTVFAVATMNSSTEPYGRMFCFGATGFQDNNSVGSWTVLRDNSNQNVWFQRNGISPAPKSIAAYGTPFRLIATINSSGVMTLYVNGVASATGTQAGNWIGGGQFRVGGDFVGSQWNGMVSEFGVATGFSDAATVAQLDTCLKNSWGL